VTGLGGSSSKGSTLVIRTQGALSKNIWNSWGGHSKNIGIDGVVILFPHMGFGILIGVIPLEEHQNAL